MATRRNSFEKRERERSKRAKQAAKRERRQSREEEASSGSDSEVGTGTGADQAMVMEELAQLHRAFDDGGVSFEEFEERRAELMDRLRID